MLMLRNMVAHACLVLILVATSGPISAAAWLSAPTDVITDTAAIAGGGLPANTEFALDVFDGQGRQISSHRVVTDVFGYFEFDLPLTKADIYTLELRPP